MKSFFALTILLITSLNLFGQNNRLGVEITPTYHFQLLKNQQTNLRSTVSGQGFSTGIIYQRKFGDFTRFDTGLKFDFIAFNQKSGDFLLTSYRASGLNVPLVFSRNIGLSENWHYVFGGGFSYLFSNRILSLGNWININSTVNQLQPYITLGFKYLPRVDSHFELVVNGRYGVIDNYTKPTQNSSDANTHLAAFEFSIKYFIQTGNEN